MAVTEAEWLSVRYSPTMRCLGFLGEKGRVVDVESKCRMDASLRGRGFAIFLCLSSVQARFHLNAMG